MPLPKKYSISLIFPAYNDAGTIAELVEDGVRVLSDCAEKFEIIIVDDGSPDETEKVGQRMAEKYPQVRLIRHPVHRGYGAALKTGLEHTRDFELVCFTDGDYPIALSFIPRLLEFLADHDGVITRRINKPYGAFRGFISWLYNFSLRRLFGIAFADLNSPLKIYKKSVLRETPWHSQSPFAVAEIVIRSRERGAKLSEIPVASLPPKNQRSFSVRPRIILATILDGWKFIWRSGLY